VEFCILSPIAGLERYSKLSRHHLVLPQITNPIYQNFYLERKAAGDHIILDNGAWEGQLDRTRLLHCIELYSPDMVVLPDHLLQDWKKTWHDSSDFLDNYYNSYETQWGYVPQSSPGDIVGWVEGLTHALQDSRISWICLPRALGTDIVRDIAVRANVCRYIKSRGKKVHALGMLSGSVAELELLRDAGCNSIDSNAPVWRGVCGWKLDAKEEWPGIKVDYEPETVLYKQQPCGVGNEVTFAVGGRLFHIDWAMADGVIHETILHNLRLCNVNVNSRF
jgi:hypothetical protein